MPKESKHTEASFSLIAIDSLCFQAAHMPRSRDVAIFMVTTTTDDRRRTKLIALPLAHACRIKKFTLSNFLRLK